jgi:hypothetical protein
VTLLLPFLLFGVWWSALTLGRISRASRGEDWWLAKDWLTKSDPIASRTRLLVDRGVGPPSVQTLRRTSLTSGVWLVLVIAAIALGVQRNSSTPFYLCGGLALSGSAVRRLLLGQTWATNWSAAVEDPFTEILLRRDGRTPARTTLTIISTAELAVGVALLIAAALS